MNKKLLLFITVLIFAIIGFNIYTRYNTTSETTTTSHEINHKKITALVYGRDLCHYCVLAKKLLSDKKINYEFIDLSENQDLYLKLVKQTKQKTVPFIFINNDFIGGYQDLEKFISNSISE
ncbi:MAG: hypothetical protein HRU35_05065 [Rickettsiaceae bacterium]|nr:hypothetical protein [Rickettsiaceae bacterium]